MTRPLFLISDGGSRREQGTLVADIKSVLRSAGENVGYLLLREIGDPSCAISSATDREVIQLVDDLKETVREVGAKLILHRRIDLAVMTGVDGVHLGADGRSVRAARAVLGPRFILGYSAHSEEEAKEAESGGADYILLSPIFKPISKPTDIRSTLTLDNLKSVCSHLSIPVFALGGVSIEQIRLCKAAGAAGIAGISLFFAPGHSPAAAASNAAAAWLKAV